MATLYHMPYSPWSERARWALEHHRFAHDRRVYLPMISEVQLRLALKRPRGRFTIPILIDGDAVLDDSYDIARHAEVHGTGTPLFPEHAKAEIAEWNRRAEQAQEAGRSRATRRVGDDPEALRESLPPGMPGFLKPVGRLGLAYFARKYAIDGRDDAADRAILCAHLQAIRDTLGDRDTLLDTFTYADIVAAAVLQFVAPVSDDYIRLGPASRQAWGDAALAEEYADVVAWRDRLYQHYRKN